VKKGKAIGIGAFVIIASIMFGIASLPDEVLLESGSQETSYEVFSEESTAGKQIFEEIGPVIPIESVQEEPVVVPEEPVVVPEEPEVVPEEPEVVPEEPEVVPEEPEVAQEDGDAEKGKKIKVSVHDGAGTSMK